MKRSSDFAIPTRDNHNHDGSNTKIGPGLGVHKNKSKVQPLVISNPRPVDAQHLDELEVEANLDEARFSTADRTILNELKFKMQAREAQFKVKNGKRHHPYSPKEVPYPLHYEQSVVDYGIWEVMWMQTVTKDLTWHPLETIPQKVLDLGCGSGHWILECARHWKDTHFVGLDIVPLQPDLYQLGTSQMASRITWVQANFLEPLPFQDEEFDFIYAKRIARGVPEDKWDSLLEELTRILKPGGRFEILEEELCFPGKPVHAQPETLVDLDLSVSSPQSSDIWTNDPFGSLDSLSPPTSTSSHRPSAGYPQADWPILKRSSSGTMLGLGNIPPLPLSLSSQPSLSSRAYQKSPLHSVTLPLAAEDDDHTRDLDPEQSSRTRAPINPRDHSLLEFIYNEMHAARFINLEPLALLKNSFPLHFKHTCIHPPVILTFPPRSKSPEDSTGSGAKLHITSLLASPNPHVLIDDDRFNPFFQRAKASTSEDSITSIYEQFWRDEEGGDSPRSEGPGMSSWRHVLREGHSKHCRKPMASINFQLESLNMLLALKVHEVVACAEEMWAWVMHYQKTQPLSPHVNQRGGLWARAKPHQETLVHMSRSEFNDMVTRFQLDMQEHIGLGDTVRSRLGWNEPVTARTQARKEFDQLAAEWRIHQSMKHHPYPANGSTLSTPRLDSASTTDESDGHARSDHLPNFALPEATLRGSADENADEDLNVPLASLEPWERISRKMCIAIGWKAGRQNGI